jgi:ABC-type branched-subunit amino acid transport system ATPase component
MAALLEATDLACSFGGVQAVNGVSLRLDEGDMVALVGPNGAGKTTLLNLITGQHRPDRGRIVLAGRDVTRRTVSHPSRWAAIRSYQDGGIFGRLSARDNVAIAALCRGTGRRAATKAADEALSQLGLEPVAGERADRLSGGQRKLIDLARILVVDARVGLLDEPTAGVNPALLDVISREVRRQRENGTAFLIISHELPWVFELCSRVIVLGQGERLTEGTPEEIQADARVIDAYLA